MVLRLADRLDTLPGIGPARARGLEKLGLVTVEDLLRCYPRSYEDRRKFSTVAAAPVDIPVCLELLVAEPPRLSRIRKGLELVKARLVDDTGSLTATFFNQTYMKDALRPGETYIVYGKVEGPPGRRQMTNPVCERSDRVRFTGCILPVYTLTHGISNNLLAGLARRCVDECAGQLEEVLPGPLRREHALAAAEFACRNIHFPRDEEALELARRRLTFEELFYLSAGLAMLKERRGDALGCAVPYRPMGEFLKRLPFPLTGAQRRVMEEMSADLSSGVPMNRLVQGDVGSGKTAVAGYAAYLCAQNGGQTALMVPTELLAEQHFRSLSALLEPAGVRVGLLTGSLTPANKKKVRQVLAAGEIDLIIGTHALISPQVEFHRLALIVADEQHRFGVAQRAALAGKSETGGMPPPHVLVMSATPIPRTLALIIYGDLDVSVIDELPPGRQKIDTFAVTSAYRQRIYAFLRKEIAAGRQAYIICSMVEKGEEVPDERKAVTEYAAMLQEKVFPDLRVAYVHGRMKPREKDAVMAAFAAGERDILVSTTVVEVGVDVPNATVMVVEDADRFGLSQLHQLRGRVGRGQHKSYCILISDNRNEETRRRLKVMTQTGDGFKIAEEDLRLRGPGDFFGRRQHGLPALKVADLSCDMALLKEAQGAAEDLLKRDPELRDHLRTAQRVAQLLEVNADAMN